LLNLKNQKIYLTLFILGEVLPTPFLTLFLTFTLLLKSYSNSFGKKSKNWINRYFSKFISDFGKKMLLKNIKLQVHQMY